MPALQPPAPPSTAADWVVLRQADFDAGTYRIRTSGRYRLGESIRFRPNPDDDFRPRADQAALYPTTGAEAGYRLGFFAALTIEVPDVELHLNGMTIEQHPDHALQQRFFAVIELADQPFIPGQGPSDFGATIQAANRVWIHGGTIGLSSHHGIHGNDNQDVLLEDLRFRDFEVAGVAVNGVRRLKLAHSIVGPARTDVPVLGTYSAARFLAPVLAGVDPALTITLRGQSHTAAEIAARLAAATASVFAGAPSGDAQFFVNPAEATDGPAYGVLINRRGVAVNKFACCSDRADEASWAQDVHLDRVVVRDIRPAPQEVIAVSRAGNAAAAQVGLFGEVFPAAAVAGPDGAYVGTVLSDAQLLLAKHTTMTGIGAEMVAWAEAGGALADVMAASALRYLPNGDSMFHVHKGALGIRADGVLRLVASDTLVRDVVNTGPVGTRALGAYNDATAGHPKQNSGMGFSGNQSRGIGLSRCLGVNLNRVTVKDITSDTGGCWGVDAMYNSKQVSGLRVRVHDVHANTTNSASGYAHRNGVGIDLQQTETYTFSQCTVRRVTGDRFSMVRAAHADTGVTPCRCFGIQRGPRKSYTLMQ